MTNDLDELMDRDPLQLSSQDIDKIIAYQRQYRSKLETGSLKGKKAKVEFKGKIDLSALLGAPAAAPVSTIKRRF